MPQHLLAIGVNGSRSDREVALLKYAEKDAKAIHAVFRDELGYGDNAHLLHSPTFAQVRHKLADISHRVRTGDTLVVYFAGHGQVVGDDHYLLLADANLGDLEHGFTAGNDLLSLKWLRAEVAGKWVRGMQAAYILDSCRTHIRRGGRGSSQAGSELLHRQLAGLKARGDTALDVGPAAGAGRPASQLVMYACAEENQAWEFDAVGRGCASVVFERWLREGVKDNRERVLEASLDQHFAEALEDLGREHRTRLPQQRPLFEPGSPPVLLWKPTAPPAPPPPPAWAALQQRFDEQLAAGRLTDPFGDCARDTLSHMGVLGLPAEQQTALFGRLNQALTEQQRLRDAEHDRALISDAEQLDTETEWSQVRLLARLPENKALALERLRELRCKAAEAASAPPPAPTPAADETDFLALGAEPGEAACQRFLTRHPASAHAAQVREWLTRAQDEAAWYRALTRNSEEGFQAYIDAWPTGRHGEAAREALQKFAQQRTEAQARAAEQQRQRDEASRAAERHRLEDADFDHAHAQNTPEAWRAFLDRWPSGRGQRHSEAAQRLELAVQREAAQRAQQPQGTAQAISHTFLTIDAKAAEQAKARAKAWAAERAKAAATAALNAQATDGTSAKATAKPKPAAHTRSTPSPKIGVAAGAATLGALALMGVWWLVRPQMAPTPQAAAPDVSLAGSSEQPAPPQINSASQPAAVARIDAKPIQAAQVASDYRQSRGALLASAWWTPEQLTATDGKVPSTAARVLDTAELAAANGVPEALLDIGQARAFGHGRPAAPEQAARDLLAWMQATGTPSAQDRARATEALDQALATAIRRKPGGDWAPLARAAAKLPATWPRDYWQGVIQRCLQQPPDNTAAQAVLQRMASSTVSMPGADAYRALAASHLRCLARGQGCGGACTE